MSDQLTHCGQTLFVVVPTQELRIRPPAHPEGEETVEPLDKPANTWVCLNCWNPVALVDGRIQVVEE